MSRRWHKKEEKIFDTAQAYARDDSASGKPRLGDKLLELGERVYKRAHRKQVILRKSGEITRLLRLLDSEKLYPEGIRLEERLDFLLTVLEGCPQRPVLDCAGLVLLDMELDFNWSATSALKTRAIFVCRKAQIPVMPLVALESRLVGHPVARERFSGLDFNERRLRMVELISVLDTYPQAKGLETLVSDTFEAVFQDTDARERKLLVLRLLDEFERRRTVKRHDRWKLMIDPLILQNHGAPKLLGRIMKLVVGLPGPVLTPYLRFYLETVPEERLSATVVQHAQHCGPSLIPILSTLSLQSGFFGKTAVARAATNAREAIVKRAGLTGLSGGLALVQDGTEGILSLADAQAGPLSLVETEGDLPLAWQKPTLWVSGLALLSAMVAYLI